MQAIWKEEVKIKVFETDLTGKLKLSFLFNHFQEAAGNHAADLGVGYFQLKEKNLFWVLSRIKVNILRMPDWGEPLTITTWPKGIDKLFALRDFNFIDSIGNIIVSGTSCWLLIEINNYKLHKIEELGIYVPEENKLNHALSETLEKIKPLEVIHEVYQHKVTFNEIDIHQHVNNSHYADWIADSLNPEILEKPFIKSIQINFLEETKFGEEIEIKHTKNESQYYFEGLKKTVQVKIFQALVEY